MTSQLTDDEPLTNHLLAPFSIAICVALTAEFLLEAYVFKTKLPYAKGKFEI